MVDRADGQMIGHVAILGGGAIGIGMAAVIADSGVAVDLVEPDPDRRTTAPQRIVAQHADIKLATLNRSETDEICADIRSVPDLFAAREQPMLVVEAGPERLDLKREIFHEVRQWGGRDVPLVTTSSALTISEILPDPAERAHCLCAHCVNPPSILRIIECVPAPETEAETVRAVGSMLEFFGFSVVPLKKEIPGFAFNRLQSAMLREAYRLVEDGVIDVGGIDRLVTDGLGPRWALSGPFETAELNTPGGIPAHAARMGPAYSAIGKAIGERNASWSDALVAEVDRQRKAILPEEARPARLDWRRRSVARLIAARRALLADWETPKSQPADGDV